jgi:hypothetical protein
MCFYLRFSILVLLLKIKIEKLIQNLIRSLSFTFLYKKTKFDLNKKFKAKEKKTKFERGFKGGLGERNYYYEFFFLFFLIEYYYFFLCANK